jgi:hypothetical protein
MNEVERLQYLLQLETVTREMRVWQTLYFKRRDRASLVESKRLEATVDQQLRALSRLRPDAPA